jgi:hypothetical protein
MAWTFAKGPFGMYRVGQRQGKTFIPVIGFINSTDATRAVANLNNAVPWVPPAPLPMPPPGAMRFGKVTAKPVSAKLR